MKSLIIIGRPNVGKSSLFNRLAGARIAITSDVAGTTRDTNKAEAEIFDRRVRVIDSGGLDDTSELFARVQAKTLSEAKSADLIIFMTDGKLLPSDDERRIFFSLQRLGKPIALAVNKIDGKRDEERSWEFNEFGVKFFPMDPAPARQDEDEIFDDFIEGFNDEGEPKEGRDEEFYASKTIGVGIIGRVNVGKSSLLNALVGSQRSVVSDYAGTTIDPVNESTEFGGRTLEFIDTAGIRRRGKIEGIERFALNRTEKILQNSDIALLVLDASEPLNELDERIAGLAAKFELGLIIILNKWDLRKRDYDEFCRDLRDRFKFLSYAPIISVSATDRKRIHKIYPLILEVYSNFTRKLGTARINEAVEAAIKAHPIPRERGKSVKIYYAAQIGFAPPKIALVMNRSGALHFSYKRYLMNRLRASFALSGSPLVLLPRKKGESDEER